MPTATRTTLTAMHLREMDPAVLTLTIGDGLDALDTDTGVVREALRVAALAHVTQRRPGHGDFPVDPYVIHPFRNVLRILRYGCVDIDVLAATALHDTVEDQPDRVVAILGGTDASAALSEHFGPAVADIVAAVTNPPTPEGLDPEAKRRAYVEHVESAIVNPQVYLVKVSDFIDNAGSLRYLADDATRTTLGAKYAPLVVVFHSALTAHGHALGLTGQGFDTLSARLDRLAASLA